MRRRPCGAVLPGAAPAPTRPRDGYNSHPRVGQWGSRARITRLAGSRDGGPPEGRITGIPVLELGRTRNRLLLRESLVRTRLVVEAHELGDEASEVVLAEEEDVVEQLPAQGAREPFGERVHVRCLGGNPHDTRP